MAKLAQVATCNRVGVRVYADAVINHMSKQGSGKGTGRSVYDTLAMNYEGVPYNRSHFNQKNKCPSPSGDIQDYSNADQVLILFYNQHKWLKYVVIYHFVINALNSHCKGTQL